jgi:hypothetical protein
MTTPGSETRFEAERFLTFLRPDEHSVFEVRVIKPSKPFSTHWEGSGRTPLGFYRNRVKAVEQALSADLDEGVHPSGIYVTLNPLSEDLLSRANERLRANVNGSRDEDVRCFQNLLIDLDPIRLPGINSTDEEHQAALGLAENIQNTLLVQGWPEPYRGSSGNGAALIYKLPNLPNEEFSKNLIKETLKALSSEFDMKQVKIDQSVGNPSRLVRLPGTLNRKGDSTESRPQRYAGIISIPENPKPVSIGLLKILSNTSNEVVESSLHGDIIDPRPGKLDVRKYLAHYGQTLLRVKGHGESTLFVLQQCVFNPAHQGGEAAIGQQAEGRLFYYCFHDSCKKKTWREARRLISGDDSLEPFLRSVNTTRSNIGSISFADILELPKDDTPPLIRGVCYPSTPILVTGPTGIGKSEVAIDLGLAFAGSALFLQEWNVETNHRVLYIQSENTLRNLQDRITRLPHDWSGKRTDVMKRIFILEKDRNCQGLISKDNRQN